MLLKVRPTVAAETEAHAEEKEEPLGASALQICSPPFIP